MWCENIKIVQDKLTLWPSVEFNFLIALGSIGLLILIASLLVMKSDKGAVIGGIMIFFCLFGIERQSKKTEMATDIFVNDQKAEFIGKVTDLEIEVDLNFGEIDGAFGTTGPIKFTKIEREPKIFFRSYKTVSPITSPRGIILNHLSPDGYDIIWFRIGDKLIRSDIKTVGLNLDNECDGRKCGLRAGDMARVSVDKSRIEKRHHKAKLDYYYSETLRIERCDD